MNAQTGLPISTSELMLFCRQRLLIDSVSVVADAHVHTAVLMKVENGNVQPHVFHSCSRSAYTTYTSVGMAGSSLLCIRNLFY
ncbi:hypothetical protein DUNSADRAFT_9875 [Dunaliella salina]|uniref:Encoded protein n=1 Tax=Dunaliella salina TaxID=3046 RepID=A0ABQ7H561_DUNSA|nr:hypothetical protein DUNSADRAFT_9875 [Dunaliella salina]|eukprot:KAF5841994.1 hypothetical protein DUNSADRAFT_9875 [Dunaliella salina]